MPATVDNTIAAELSPTRRDSTFSYSPASPPLQLAEMDRLRGTASSLEHIRTPGICSNSRRVSIVVASGIASLKIGAPGHAWIQNCWSWISSIFPPISECFWVDASSFNLQQHKFKRANPVVPREDDPIGKETPIYGIAVEKCKFQLLIINLIK